jgi:hypothetical protein
MRALGTLKRPRRTLGGVIEESASSFFGRIHAQITFCCLDIGMAKPECNSTQVAWSFQSHYSAAVSQGWGDIRLVANDGQRIVAGLTCLAMLKPS